MGPGRELAQPLPSQFTHRAVGPAWRWGEDPGRATASTKHRMTQAPCCPCCRHTQKCMPLVHLQTFPHTSAAGATVMAQGTTRPCCTRMVWVQPRIGPRAREEALGTFWEVLPKPRALGPRWPSEDPVPTAMLGWEDPRSTQIAQPQGLQLRGWAARARPRGGGLYRTAQGLARSPSGRGVRGWGPLGKPQGKIWLDLGRDRTAARRVNAQPWGLQRPLLQGSAERIQAVELPWLNTAYQGPAMSEMPGSWGSPSVGLGSPLWQSPLASWSFFLPNPRSSLCPALCICVCVGGGGVCFCSFVGNNISSFFFGCIGSSLLHVGFL